MNLVKLLKLKVIVLKKEKIKKLLIILKKDFKLKLLCLGLGIMMWFFVIGGINPVVTRQFKDVAVRYKNEAFLEKNNFLITKPKKPTVTVNIRGNRNEVFAVNKSDIVAEISLDSNITPGTHRLLVNVKVPKHVELDSVSEREILVSFDEEITKNFDVTVETKGEIKNKNQVVSKKEPDDKFVMVTGPASYIKRIKKVLAEVDVTGKETDEVVLSKLRAVDEDGKVIEGVELSKTDTNVSIGFKNFKEVPIELVEVNSPSNDIMILRKNLVPKVVSIVGNVNSLEKIKEIKTKPFDLSTIKESKVYDLTLDLPKDITLVNKDLKPVINIDVDKKLEKVLKVKTETLSIEGVDDVILQGLKDNIEVTIRGYESVISDLKPDDIKLYVKIDSSDIGKNVQIKAKSIENVEIVKILNDIVKVVGK